jgi:hypothetical protein
MNTTQHTPTPWTFNDTDGTIRADANSVSDQMGDYRGSIIADLKPALGCDEWTGSAREHARAETEANAAFIVRACNAHDDLVAALSAFVNDPPHPLGVEWWELIDKARAELAKAGKP